MALDLRDSGLVRGKKTEIGPDWAQKVGGRGRYDGREDLRCGSVPITCG